MRIRVLPLLSVLLLSACSSGGESSSSIPTEHSYEEVADFQITYDQSFSISENPHYIYFYQETCHSCQEIKNDVISLALSKAVEIYFVVATEQIPHTYSYDTINDSIGSDNVNDIFVAVTPQLAYIKDGKINKNIIKTIYILEELSHYQN